MGEIIFLNGKFVPKSEAKISVLEPGLLYGWGAFETMRAYNLKIVYLKHHLERIKNACRILEIKFPYSITEFSGIIKKAIRINGYSDSYVRLSLYKNEKSSTTVVMVKEYRPYPLTKYQEGFSACISTLKQNENSILSQVKSTNYLFYRFAYLEAQKKAFDEAMILNHKGFIAECSRSNVFLVKNRYLGTPSLTCGCLNGITRKVITDVSKKSKLKVKEGTFSLEDLRQADEAFLTNSLMGVMPLVSLEKHCINKGRPGRVTKFFMQQYNHILKNTKPL